MQRKENSSIFRGKSARLGQAFSHHVGEENLSKFGFRRDEWEGTARASKLGDVLAGCSHNPASTRSSTAADCRRRAADALSKRGERHDARSVNVSRSRA